MSNERTVGRLILKGLDMRIRWEDGFRQMRADCQRAALFEAMEQIKQEFAETFIREALK